MPSYSSKYYDPVKAHEYYEQHKKLKGRTASTSSLNDTGKKAASYVKDQVNKERDKKLESENLKYNEKISQSTAQASEKIKSLQKKFSKLSAAQKKILGPKIKRELENLKVENARKREILQNEYSKNRQKINEDYENKYVDEVERMNKDSSMLKTTETKKTTKTSTKKKSTSKKTTKASSVKKKSVEEQIAEKRKEARELMKKKKK